jgi:hypothetical protein
MLYSDHILPVTQAIEMENTGDIHIYHSGRTLSSLNGLPQFSVWEQNWKDLISKYRKVPLSKLFNFIDFDYRIEYKFEREDEPFIVNWVYMYAKGVAGKAQLDESHSKGRYVYILTNEAYPGYCKIGKAITPSKRIKQINGAGTVSEWKLEYALPVTDDYIVEKLIHNKLEIFRRNSHQGSSREFFEISLEDALEVLILMGEDFYNGELIKY